MIMNDEQIRIFKEAIVDYESIALAQGSAALTSSF
jgi:hypothetical protein